MLPLLAKPVLFRPNANVIVVDALQNELLRAEVLPSKLKTPCGRKSADRADAIGRLAVADVELLVPSKR